MKFAGNGIEGIGFAIPINSTTDVIDDLIEYNKSKENDAEATFDEDIRISASFHIKNRMNQQKVFIFKFLKNIVKNYMKNLFI